MPQAKRARGSAYPDETEPLPTGRSAKPINAASTPGRLTRPNFAPSRTSAQPHVRPSGGRHSCSRHQPVPGQRDFQARSETGVQSTCGQVNVFVRSAPWLRAPTRSRIQLDVSATEQDGTVGKARTIRRVANRGGGCCARAGSTNIRHKTRVASRARNGPRLRSPHPLSSSARWHGRWSVNGSSMVPLRCATRTNAMTASRAWSPGRAGIKSGTNARTPATPMASSG